MTAQPQPASRPVVYLLDATLLMHRAWHAADADDTDAAPIAVFARMMANLFERLAPSLCVAALDDPDDSWRRRLYGAYKANRKSIGDDKAAYMDEARDLLVAAGVLVCQAPGCEGDDVLAGLCAEALAEDCEVVIVTSDRDLDQLVDSRVTIYDPASEVYRDLDAVTEAWGVAPYQIRDVKALAGDTTDNVPGVAKLGIKTAAALIAEFGSLRLVYENLERAHTTPGVGKLRVASLAAHHDDALMSQRLVSLRIPDTYRTFNGRRVRMGTTAIKADWAEIDPVDCADLFRLRSDVSRYTSPTGPDEPPHPADQSGPHPAGDPATAPEPVPSTSPPSGEGRASDPSGCDTEHSQSPSPTGGGGDLDRHSARTAGAAAEVTQGSKPQDSGRPPVDGATDAEPPPIAATANEGGGRRILAPVAQLGDHDRTKTIGASEAPAGAGLSEYAGPADVYASKVEGVTISETSAMEWGRRLEGAILQRWLDDHPECRPVESYATTLVHKVELWASASPDLAAIDAAGVWYIVDAKAPRSMYVNFPARIVGQLHWQAWVLGSVLGVDPASFRLEAAVWARETAEFRAWPVEHDPALLAAMIKANRSLWVDHIVPRIPPTTRDPDQAVLLKSALSRARSNGAEVEADDWTQRLLAERARIAERARGLVQKKERADALIAAQMGLAERLVDPANGRVLATWGNGADRQGTDTEALARYLCEQHGRDYEAEARRFRVVKPGTRRFLVRVKS